jgi:hypothetical protein
MIGSGILYSELRYGRRFCRMADRHVVLTGVITVIAASHELSAMFPKPVAICLYQRGLW